MFKYLLTHPKNLKGNEGNLSAPTVGVLYHQRALSVTSCALITSPAIVIWVPTCAVSRGTLSKGSLNPDGAILLEPQMHSQSTLTGIQKLKVLWEASYLL